MARRGPHSDPKGYYTLLGIKPDASAEDVRAAYRALAKRLHPDANPAPDAAQAFRAVTEAYRVLSDPRRRAAYDARQDPRRRPQGDPVQVPEPVSCQCGRVTAQPRWLVIEEVRGLLTTTRIMTHEGVYCRQCADRDLIAASLRTWALGWWAIPMGPIHSIGVLLRNLRGGLMPKDRNARMLLDQAAVFGGRGDMDLARALAEQARGFATSAEFIHKVDSFLASLGPGSGRRLRNRWTRFGRAFRVQMLFPLGCVVVAASLYHATVGIPFGDNERRSLPPASITWETETNAPYRVTASLLNVREAPSLESVVRGTLSRDEVVVVTGVVPDGGWAHVISPDRALRGYVFRDFLVETRD